jgi:hypothetical protein
MKNNSVDRNWTEVKKKTLLVTGVAAVFFFFFGCLPGETVFCVARDCGKSGFFFF